MKCEVTGNECGTDTWGMVDGKFAGCQCEACKAYVRDLTDPLACYLIREDRQFYALGTNHEWRLSFGVFPGPSDGSVVLGLRDVPLLALRLGLDSGTELFGTAGPRAIALATSIVQWADGKSFRFVSELDPDVEPGVEPTPITGRMP